MEPASTQDPVKQGIELARQIMAFADDTACADDFLMSGESPDMVQKAAVSMAGMADVFDRASRDGSLNPGRRKSAAAYRDLARSAGGRLARVAVIASNRLKGN